MESAKEWVADDSLLLEVSLNKPAEQISHSRYSIGLSSGADAARAVSDAPSDDYAFHTEQELNPWWRVDLLQRCAIVRVEITNRKINEFKFRNFRIESSDDDFTWTLQFAKIDSTSVSSDPDAPAVFQMRQSFYARYVRIVQIGFNTMHLKRIRIYGLPTDTPENRGHVNVQLRDLSTPPLIFNKNDFVESMSVVLLEKEVLSNILEKAVRPENTVIVTLDAKNKRNIRYIALNHSNDLQQRNKTSITYLDQVIRNYGDWTNFPHDGRYFTITFQGDDRPVDATSVSWQTKTYYSKVCLVPDFYYNNNYGYSTFLPDDVKVWELRESKFFWRGATTGGFGITLETLPDLLRFQLCKYGSAFGDRADFGIYNVVQAKSDRDRQEIETHLKSLGLFRPRVKLEDYSDCKFFVQIDGNGNAWDLIQKLRLGSCMLLVDSDWVLWHYDRIFAWEHFVPVNRDLSNLSEIFEWCISNDSRAKEIGANGRKFALSLDFEEEMKKGATAMFQHAEKVA